jgi:precorrin-2 dehydrogenase/sirohydrochlorin ferrochelatase
MRYYPIFLNVRGRQALVVGGGKVAERKVRKLLRAGARVRVISPGLTPGLARLAEEEEIRVTHRSYRKSDIAVGAHGPPRRAPILVYAATNDPAAQRAVRADAALAGALVNRADSAEDSDFIVPASITRGDLHIAISTSGKDPSLARRLRLRLEADLKKGKRRRAKVKRRK